MDEFVKHSSEHATTPDVTKQAELMKEGPKKFAAFTNVKNGEPQNHGKPSLNLKDQCVLGNNQCAKTS